MNEEREHEEDGCGLYLFSLPGYGCATLNHAENDALDFYCRHGQRKLQNC